MNIELTDKERHTLVGALRLVAEDYRRYAVSCEESIRIRDHFNRQADECEKLLKKLGEEC